jgi:CMP/dCMP kinase
MIITLSGSAGSGKSTVADELSKKLNLKRYSVGDFRREKAEQLGFSLHEYNKMGEKNDFTDKDADEWQSDLGKKKDNFVIDGRLSFYFIPDSFKIYLDADEKIRAERIFKDKRKTEQFLSYEESLKKLRERQKSDERRYKKYYGINPFEKRLYDLVIDTSKISVDEVINIIIKKLKSLKLI